MKLVRQVRLELTIPCLRGRCLDPIWLLTHGGTERTRTVIDLIDNQVPHLSATVPKNRFRALSFSFRVPDLRNSKLQTHNSKLMSYSKLLVASERLELSKVSLKN